MAAPPYTTADRVAVRASQLGSDLRVDHEPVESLGQVIEDASEEVLFYLGGRYDPAALAASGWVRKVATDLACYYLCGLRFNPVPETVQAWYDQAVKQLERVQSGQAVVPGVPAGKTAAPTVTNFRVDLNRYPPVRVERPRSTGRAEGYRRRTDPTADAIDGG